MFIIAATLLSIAALAQTDTLRWGQHDPRYYYMWPGYGPWIDQFAPGSIGESWYIFNGASRILGAYRKDIGLRPCYTDRPMTVIGVAAPLRYNSERWRTDIRPGGNMIWDTSTANLPQESFVLYEWNGTRPVFIDSACWTNTTPRYCYTRAYDGDYPVYEAYFDKPHVVMDTFYVGTTNNGFYCILRQPGQSSYSFPLMYIAHTPFEIPSSLLYASGEDFENHCHRPAMQYFIPQIIYDSFTIANVTRLTDTGIIAYNTTGNFVNIYPIIDTTSVNFDDLYEGWDTIPGLGQHDCPRVSRLRPEGLGHGCVNMAWRGDSCHAAYQLKYGKFFDPEEDYRQYDVTGNNIYIDVDSNVLYKVMVRGRCGCGLEEWSPWVSTMFLLTAYNATVVDSNQLRLDEGLEMLTTVSPNPAHGKATVFSSLHIRSIDVYSADGHRLDHINVGGLSHELDLSRYAKGLCLLKINTYRGTTVRKLIVE